MLPTEDKRRQIESKGRIREFVFGIQDGLIGTVGLVAGVQAAGSSRFVILMAGIAAVLSGALGCFFHGGRRVPVVQVGERDLRP